MKKIITLILAMTMVILSFASCSFSHSSSSDLNMSDFAENLEDANFVTEYVDEDEIQELFDDLDLDPDDYSVEDMLSAFSHKVSDTISIVKCGSESEAKDFKKDIKKAYEKLFEDLEEENEFLLDIDIEFEIYGTYVLIGTSNAIEIALEGPQNNPDDDDEDDNDDNDDVIKVDFSMDFFEENLESADYDISHLSETQIAEGLEQSDLAHDPEEYGVVAMMQATSTENSTKPSVVMIFECKSDSAAKMLADDLEESYKESGVTDALDLVFESMGVFVLYGTENAIEAATTLTIMKPGEVEKTSIFEFNLRNNGYSVIKVNDEDQVDTAIEDLGLDPVLYGVEKIYLGSNSDDAEIAIFECSSESNAKDLAKDVNNENVLDIMFGTDSVKEIVVEGLFVLVGDAVALDDARN